MERTHHHISAFTVHSANAKHLQNGDAVQMKSSRFCRRLPPHLHLVVLWHKHFHQRHQQQPHQQWHYHHHYHDKCGNISLEKIGKRKGRTEGRMCADGDAPTLEGRTGPARASWASGSVGHKMCLMLYHPPHRLRQSSINEVTISFRPIRNRRSAVAAHSSVIGFRSWSTGIINVDELLDWFKLTLMPHLGVRFCVAGQFCSQRCQRVKHLLHTSSMCVCGEGFLCWASYFSEIISAPPQKKGDAGSTALRCYECETKPAR